MAGRRPTLSSARVVAAYARFVRSDNSSTVRRPAAEWWFRTLATRSRSASEALSAGRAGSSGTEGHRRTPPRRGGVRLARCNPGELMRMRGLEPPRTYVHGDLNAARLPIPPHPRDRQGSASGLRSRPLGAIAFATLKPFAPLSSRGLGRRPLTAETGVRIPVAVLRKPAHTAGFVVPKAPPRPLVLIGRGEAVARWH